MEKVLVVFSDEQKSAICRDLEEVIQAHSGVIEYRNRPRSEMIASITWAVAAGVGIWFSKSFFDGLLKKLGEATGDAIVSAFKAQFVEAQKTNERYFSRSDLTEAKEILDKGDAISWEVALDGKGKQIAPLEIVVHGFECADYKVDCRFIFMASLSEKDVGDAILEMKRKGDDIFLSAIDAEKHHFLPFPHGRTWKIDLIYSPRYKKWQTTSELMREIRLNQ